MKYVIFCVNQDIEFMERRIDDLEKSMKRSNDKQLKIEHELCLRVCGYCSSSFDLSTCLDVLSHFCICLDFLDLSGWPSLQMAAV